MKAPVLNRLFAPKAGLGQPGSPEPRRAPAPPRHRRLVFSHLGDGAVAFILPGHSRCQGQTALLGSPGWWFCPPGR